MAEKYFSLESIKQDIEWLQSAGSQELLLREVLERFEYGAIPAADVRPVVRGRWECVRPTEDNFSLRLMNCGTQYRCSCCGRRAGYKQVRLYHFCPGCGADMREENP